MRVQAGHLSDAESWWSHGRGVRPYTDQSFLASSGKVLADALDGVALIFVQG
jgi:hypothetical protein